MIYHDWFSPKWFRNPSFPPQWPQPVSFGKGCRHSFLEAWQFLSRGAGREFLKNSFEIYLFLKPKEVYII